MHTLRRFAAHHGWPHTIISDNGKSFVKTEKELKTLVQEGTNEIEDFAVVHKIRWIFTTPLSPDQGAVTRSHGMRCQLPLQKLNAWSTLDL